MWLQYPVIFIIFYFLALLQNSLLAHFNVSGAVPNLVFILFFTLVFFSFSEKRAFNWDAIFYSAVAGIFLDIFSATIFGLSVILLLLEAFLIKKAQKALRGWQNDNYPVIYFLALFFVSLIAYYLLSNGLNHFFGFSGVKTSLSWSFLAESIYNIAFASLIFWVYKNFIFPKINTRQLSLFR